MSTDTLLKSPGLRSPAVGNSLRNLIPLAVLIAFVVIISIAEPTFLGEASLQVVIDESLPILILALGQIPVLLVASIDLSSAALASLGTIILAQALSSMGPGGLIAVLVLTTLAGAINGLLVAVAQVPSFIVTLGALGLFQAIALIWSNGKTEPISVSGGYDYIGWLVNYQIAGLSLAVWVSLILVLIMCAFLFLTNAGQALYAVGLNEKASMLTGMATRRTKVMAFAISGLSAGLAAILLGAKQYSSAPALADSLLLPCIAAAIIGGCAITGGVGNPIGVLFGALILTVLRIGTTVAGVNPNAQQVIYGVTIIVAVALTIDRRRLNLIK
ncbi:MAG: ABC transporter permease [Gordonia sp. (in: high G+C Gram-positive bacteria)]|nr:MAG: ABC transporter permease [Gordonia sp. (in: high G+C Gram-positive bacteria)]